MNDDDEEDTAPPTDQKLLQLMGHSQAQRVMLQILLGKVALMTGDWRGTLANYRKMAEHGVETLEWAGSASDGAEIRAQSMWYLTTSLKELHNALATSEAADFHPPVPPKPNSPPGRA